jgi:Flp pilus assembly protein TadG
MTRADTPGGPASQAQGRFRRGRRARGDKGVALIEFAIVMPLLFLLVFGIIEFGWAFSQNLDVRHGAREGARLAAVNYGSETAIRNEICTRMSKTSSGTTVTLQRVDGPEDTNTTTGDIGDKVIVTVSHQYVQLTKMLNFALNNVTLSSKVESRIEQPATWNNLTSSPCP